MSDTNAVWYGCQPPNGGDPPWQPTKIPWYPGPSELVEIKPTVSAAMVAEIVDVLRLAVRIVKATRQKKEATLIARMEQLIRLLEGVTK
jgi:hypothetical protein